MAQFNSYPALSVQGPTDVALQGQRLKNMRGQGELQQFQLQQGRSEVQRQGQLRGVMGGVGAEAGLGPNAQEALGIDPSMIGELLKVPKVERDRARKQGEMMANLLMPVATAQNPLQQQQAWSMAVQQAQQAGMPMEKVPQALDMNWVNSMLAKWGKLKTALDMADRMPGDYRRAEGGGLEFTPGGPADPAQVGRLATAKRDPGGNTTPAQQANNAEIDAARQTLDRMGLDKAEILRRTQKATNIGRANPDYDPSLERLLRTATQRKVGVDPEFAVIHRRYLGPAPQFSDPAGMRPLPPGVSAEQPGFLDRVGGFLFGGDDAPAPASSGAAPRRGTPRAGGRVRGRHRGGAKAIQKMSLAEIDDLVNTKGDSLSPAELKAVQARLTELGM